MSVLEDTADWVRDSVQADDAFAAVAAADAGGLVYAADVVGSDPILGLLVGGMGSVGVMAGAGAALGRYPDRLWDPARAGMRGQVERARAEMVPQELDQDYVDEVIAAELGDAPEAVDRDVVGAARERALAAEPLALVEETDYLALADRPMEAVVRDLMYEAVEQQIPGHLTGSNHLYMGEQLHPDRIYQGLVQDHARFVRESGADQALGDAVLQELDGQELGRGVLDQHEEELRMAADVHVQRLDGDAAERYAAARDHNHRVLDRYRPGRAVEILDREWGAAEMPYDVYLIEAPEELRAAHQDVGTCRRNKHGGYFEAMAGDPGTVVFGVRRDDADGWTGFGRAYLLDEEDGAETRTWLGFDAIEPRYLAGEEGYDPTEACDFADYGDMLFVPVLAGMRYAREQGLAGVVTADPRSGGGDPDQYVAENSVGPNHIYGGNSDNPMVLEKQGDDIRHVYSFSNHITGGASDNVDVLFETMRTGVDRD